MPSLVPSRSRRIALAVGLAFPALVAMSTPASAATPKLSFRTVTTGLTKPVFVTNAGDGRLFIVEQIGRVRVRQTTGAISTFLDIRDRVNSTGHEQGLFSIAFHPNYNRSGTWGYLRFYVNYTNAAGDVILSEFKRLSTDPNRAYITSQRIVLTIPHPTYINHNGGQLAFGPDWMLYMSIGDGGGGDSHNNAQYRGTLLGKVIRINPDPVPGSGLEYTTPTDNPFYTLPTGRKEIWSTGLRNPWRISFDASRGDMYVADVGQSRYEEVNRARANSSRLNGGRGRNYGWDCYEAYWTYDFTNCTSKSKTFPVTYYGHGNPEVNCAVTGGYVERRKTALYGRYIFGDFCSGHIWSISADSTASRQTPTLLKDTPFHISSFGRGATGRLYLTDLYTGTVYEILAS